MDRTLSGLGLVFMIVVLIAFLYNEYREGYRPAGPYYTYSSQSASVYGAQSGYGQVMYNPPYNSYNYGSYSGSSWRMPMSFGECASMGYPIGESYPRRCFTRDATFVETVTTYTNTNQSSNTFSNSYDTNTYSY